MESVSKNVEKLEPLCIASRNENGEATVKKAWWFLKKLKIELPCDPAILFLRCISKRI